MRSHRARFVAMHKLIPISFAGLASLVLTLAGCTRSAEEVRADRMAREQHSAEQPTDEARAAADVVAASDADMVSAVTAANTTKPISLKFRIGSRPVVGKPLKLELAVLPDSPTRIVRVHLIFQPSEGLAVVGEHEMDIDEIAAQSRVQRELTLQPLQPGVLSLTATAVVDTDAESISRSYTIPLIALPAGS
jgi:hypothetical protein